MTTPQEIIATRDQLDQTMTTKTTAREEARFYRWTAAIASQTAMAALVEAPAGSWDIRDDAERISQRASELIRQEGWTDADSKETSHLLDQARDVFRRAFDRAHAK